jgi:two-component system sensor kinase FixL
MPAGPAKKDDVEQLRSVIAGLTHELAEALTALASYLNACQHIEDLNDLAGQARLRGAIGKAIEQTARAGEIIGRLRASVESD